MILRSINEQHTYNVHMLCDVPLNILITPN